MNRTLNGRRGLAVVVLLVLASLGSALAATIDVGTDGDGTNFTAITTSQTWTADNVYILKEVIYISNGATLTIEPGTVIRGEPATSTSAGDPGSLVIARGAKIRALGTAIRPIVFTDLDDDNIGSNPGTSPYDTRSGVAGSVTGNWGGLILLGYGYVANNTAAGPSALREVQIEGLQSSGALGLYGNCALKYPSPYGRVCDDDDSGVVRYVSIRYGGFNLSTANEINGVTAGGVGRSTDLDYIEVYQTKDDLIEFFGGAAQVKHFVGANGGDDGVDYDEGYRGKLQFAFIVQGKPSAADVTDKGAEMDGGNGPDGSLPLTIPALYNVTYVGLGGTKAFTGRATNTALHFRDNAGGRYYNSFFADFGGAPICIEGGSRAPGGGGNPTGANTSGERSITAYVPDANLYLEPASDRQLELQDNEFWCFGNSGLVVSGDYGLDVAPNGCDANKIYYDNGLFTNSSLQNAYRSCASALPIRQLTRTPGAASDPDPVDLIDPRPVAGGVLLQGLDRVPPADGFFEPAPYKGAFGSENWADGWTVLSRLGYFPPKPVVDVGTDGDGTNFTTITTSQTWSADNEYRLKEVIYVANGATLTIEPGTLIRGESATSTSAGDPGTLVVARGAKIRALGTATRPIVFTDLDDDNVGNRPGTSPYDTRSGVAGSITGNWGGLILLGYGYVANNTAAVPSATREVQIEGLQSSGALGLYGNCALKYPSPYGRVCDDDDSGTVNYTSIRYGGFNLSTANEINGVTAGGVGRTTNLDYIEVYQTKDDLIEFFGGAAQVKHFVGGNGGDDGIDYDEGYRGRVQFAFVMQGKPSAADVTDKGAEMDGGNGPDGSLPLTIPTLYNVTYVGLGGTKSYTGSATNTALHFRDNAGGRYYNSFFADFGGAPACIEGGSRAGGGGGNPTGANTSGERSITAYTPDGNLYLEPASDRQLELQDNEFWCFGNGGAVPNGDFGLDVAPNGCDANKIYYDNGLFSNAALDNRYRACNDPLPIRTLTRSTSAPADPNPIDVIDPRPASGGVLLTTNRTVPAAGGFFDGAQYKGAFAPGSNWANGWSTLSRLGYFPACGGGNTTATPDGVQGLVFATLTELQWQPALAGNVLRYDTLRSSSATGFDTAACLELDTDGNTQDNPSDLVTVDTTKPSPGTAFFYLVRAQNTCGGGTLGFRTDGAERTGPAACN